MMQALGFNLMGCPINEGAVMKGAISRNSANFNCHRMMRRNAAEAYLR